MRSFIAVPIPDKCREMLAKLQRELQESRAEVRWSNIQSIHLTLKFLGEVDQTIPTRIAEALNASSVSLQPFTLRLATLGSFPTPKNPRILWCGVEGDTEMLSNLHAKVETVCSALGLPSENRSFQPHLTLGRVKGRKNLHPLMDRIRSGWEQEGSFTVDHFNIYKSVLMPQGAVYTVVETIALK
ncbi:MAG: RNA 2',3'-cyclic phosphodiesterase [Acidobacteriota bacterium]